MRRKSVFRAAAVAAFAAMASVGQVQAQDTCGGLYTVRPGDSLSAIADRMYRNAGMWSAIHTNNIQSIGPKANNIRAGQKLRLSCINGLPTGLPGGQPVTDSAKATIPAAGVTQNTPQTRVTRRRGAEVSVRILAGDGYPPFSDRLLYSSGIMSDVVNRAYAASDMEGRHQFYWINDRSAHLDPMLANGMADVAFPWIKPSCEDGGTCADFVYSDPMFEMLVLLFTRRGSGLSFNDGADLAGHRLCRPKGLQLDALKGSDGDWLRNNRVTVMQPATAQECFARLVRGETDYVALNEFTGRMVLAEMDLRNEVEILAARPMSIESLHVVAHRSNPDAEEMIAHFNQGLAAIRKSGEYEATVDAHLSSIWAGF